VGGLYTKDSIERVKDAVDMVELVGARSELRRAGRQWTGLCPFHDERTPSFSVDPEHKLYHCFGCGESGDAIKFVEATEALDFKEAVEQLAERYGVELKREQEDPRAEERRLRRERLMRLVERATAYYERVLWESAEAARAREYLAGRGLGEETLRAFRVGYSPSAWDKVMSAAQRDGFSHEELVAAGLAQRNRDGRIYDRFRGRVMFPLADARGRVLGFGARSVRDEQRPKYLNTSENELYHKGRQLFGIDRARAAAAKQGRVVAVEGYTDVLALHQAGIPEVVAIMGTALTQEQLLELGRAARTVYLALDADRAGQEAMLRAARAADGAGIELLVVSMPDGRDPADLVAQGGAEAFRHLLDRALTVAEFELRRVVAEADLSTPRGRDRALAAARPILATVPPNTATRDELVRYVADRLDVNPEYVMSQADAPAARDAAAEQDAPRPAPRVTPLDAVARTERTFLSMCVGSEVGREYLEQMTPEHFSYEPLNRVREHLLRHWDDPLIALPDDDESFASLIKDVVLRADNDDVSADVLRLTFLQLELRRVERGLRHAERGADFDAQRTLAVERQGLRDQIDELMGLTL
jgi:DNA primase